MGMIIIDMIMIALNAWFLDGEEREGVKQLWVGLIIFWVLYLIYDTLKFFGWAGL